MPVMRPARHWHKTNEDIIQCDLCPHACQLSDMKTGRCRVRRAVNGALTALGYGLISSAGLDPVEKKPLYHFFPGSTIFSMGGWGCNFSCTFCQNWSISQSLKEAHELSAEEIVSRALSDGSIGMAYTYNEPLVGYEYVYDCAVRNRDAGGKNVLVTNGFVNSDPARELLPFVDALNIDVKSMEDAFYKQHCRASLQPVLDFCELARETGCHIEITCLVIPGLNDDEQNIAKLSRWMATVLGRDTPLHLSAYFPQYKMKIMPTSVFALEGLFAVAQEHLDYVYLGNIRSRTGRDTICPRCGAVAIHRAGYRTEAAGVLDGQCAACGKELSIIGGTW